MRHQLSCLLCKTPGYASLKVWFRETLLLAITPNIRSGPRPWICRKCIKKHSKLSDEDFLELILKATQQKS